MKRDTIWVFHTFGFWAGVHFLCDSLKLWIKRTLNQEQNQKFENLTDDEAQSVALGFGITGWTDRNNLNRTWNEFKKNLN